MKHNFDQVSVNNSYLLKRVAEQAHKDFGGNQHRNARDAKKANQSKLSSPKHQYINQVSYQNYSPDESKPTLDNSALAVPFAVSDFKSPQNHHL